MMAYETFDSLGHVAGELADRAARRVHGWARRMGLSVDVDGSASSSYLILADDDGEQVRKVRFSDHPGGGWRRGGTATLNIDYADFLYLLVEGEDYADMFPRHDPGDAIPYDEAVSDEREWLPLAVERTDMRDMVEEAIRHVKEWRP